MMAQPVSGSSSSAAAALKPFCSNDAFAECSARSLPSEVALKRERTKFPLGLRPGPFAGSAGSGSTSNRRPEMTPSGRVKVRV